MSNTADVSPYESDSAVTREYSSASAGETASAISGAALAVGVAAAIGAIACARFLVQSTEGQRAARAARRRSDYARLAHEARSNPATVALRVPLASMLESSRTLGFRPVSIPDPHPELKGDAAPVLLQNDRGERIALQNFRGRLMASSRGDLALLHRVVHQNQLIAAAKHLQAVSGRPVRMRNLPDGALEVQASEPTSGAAGAPATLTARIASHGATTLDISGTKGTRCDQLLADYARAVSGEPRNVRFKPAYYDTVLPGEPARVRG